MRITCPNCAAEYEVDAGMIPESGRDVQCSACGHTWFQFEDGRAQEITPAPSDVTPGPDVDEPAVRDAGMAGDTADERSGDDASDIPQAHGRRQLDDETRRILKEEAEREAAARKARRRAASAPLETQGDLGLNVDAEPPSDDNDADSASRTDTPAGVAAPDPDGTDAPSGNTQGDRSGARAHAAPTRSRSDRLPDIEEINSTLAARPRKGTDDGEPQTSTTSPQADTGFGKGFVLMLLVALILIALYLLAPRIAAAVPSTEAAMATYVDAANALRTTVNDALQSAADAIESVVGGDGSEPDS